MAKGNNKDKIRKSYQFFLEKQKRNQAFTIEDISSATGWGKCTVTTYRTKKWTDILICQPDKNFLANIGGYTEDAYVRFMSQNYKQSLEPFRPELPELVEEYVIKARDSAILAIDIYNRPVVSFRSQGYIVLMIIAWTALFHAIYESIGKNYYYKIKDDYELIDGEKKAFELEKCIDMCGNMLSNAEKQNLKLFIKLRNKIEHRHVPKFDFFIFGECQAMLLNFESLITKKFTSYYALNNALSIPLQVSSIRTNAQTKAIKKIQAEHYDELKKYVEVYRESLVRSVASDSQYSFRVFLVPKIGNHRSSSDCAVDYVKYDPKKPEEFEAINKCIAMIKERCVPVANQGKYKPKKVCDTLTEELGWKVPIALHTSAWKYYKVRNPGAGAGGCDTKYCQFDEAHQDYIYTQDWINFLCDKFKDINELSKIKSYNK